MSTVASVEDFNEKQELKQVVENPPIPLPQQSPSVASPKNVIYTIADLPPTSLIGIAWDVDYLKVYWNQELSMLSDHGFAEVEANISKPAGANWRQASMFSGDKWFHCYGAQGICGPDGIIWDWFDGPVGSEIDKNFLRESHAGQNIKYWAYLDKGYDWQTCCRAARRGPHLTEAQKDDNEP
eukprot:gene25037-31446_t